MRGRRRLIAARATARGLREDKKPSLVVQRTSSDIPARSVSLGAEIQHHRRGCGMDVSLAGELGVAIPQSKADCSAATFAYCRTSCDVLARFDAFGCGLRSAKPVSAGSGASVRGGGLGDDCLCSHHLEDSLEPRRATLAVCVRHRSNRTRQAGGAGESVNMKSAAKRIAYALMEILLLGRGVKRNIAGSKVRLPVRFSRYYAANYESQTLSFIKRSCKEGDTVFDLGAHLGLITVVMAQCVGPNGNVISFEPTPFTNG